MQLSSVESCVQVRIISVEFSRVLWRPVGLRRVSAVECSRVCVKVRAISAELSWVLQKYVAPIREVQLSSVELCVQVECFSLRALILLKLVLLGW